MVNYGELVQAVSHSVVIFFLLLILTRLIGKKLLAQMTFFDFVTGITIGTIGGAFVTTEVKGYYVSIIEPHGQLSVLKKSQYLPITPKDLKMPTNYKGVSSEIIRDGRIVEQNLKQNNLTHEWLFNELLSRNIRNIRDIYLATLSTDGNLYVDLRNDSLEYIQEVEDDDSII